MSIALNEFGLLPPGVHDYSLEDIADTFGRFQRSDMRLKLMERLRAFVESVGKVDTVIEILIDGSFIMGSVGEPGDIDVILIFPANWDFSADLPPFKYNAVTKRAVRRLVGFDMLIGVAGEESESTAVGFFSRVNAKWIERLGIPEGTKKGLIRVKR